MAMRMIEANGVKLCTDAVGDPGDPPVLLVMGMGASMMWWDERFCRRLANKRRFVVRYDHRDTGRSVVYDPGSPGYTVTDLVADACTVLDTYGLAAAHVVGMSMGGALAQLLALDFPDRVLSLVLISTSPATPGQRSLPPGTEAFRRFLGTARVDWSEASSVVDYIVEYWRVLWGHERAFDEEYIRDLAGRDVARASCVAAAQNHGVLPDEDRPRTTLSSITAPTLVIHGSQDPMFPLEHGAALASEIPGGELLALEGAGHGIDPADWDTVIRAIVNHTSPPRAMKERGTRLAPDGVECRLGRWPDAEGTGDWRGQPPVPAPK
jgi:pimeloyl-ACP methyl ester carboxylesterase